MNSGKSTNMLQAAYNYEERGQQVLLTKPQIDTKGDSDIVSRLGVRRPVDFTISPDDDMWDLFAKKRSSAEKVTGKPVSCLLVDEAQFLTEGQVDDLLRIAILGEVPVLAAVAVEKLCSIPAPSLGSTFSMARRLPSKTVWMSSTFLSAVPVICRKAVAYSTAVTECCQKPPPANTTPRPTLTLPNLY